MRHDARMSGGEVMKPCKFCHESEATDGGLCVDCDDQFGEVNRDAETEERGFEYEY
jgi:hypothetical protein